MKKNDQIIGIVFFLTVKIKMLHFGTKRKKCPKESKWSSLEKKNIFC